MGKARPQNFWYHTYVLLLLLIISICNVATRNLPSYLITVQVPECEAVCKGVPTRPLCSRSAFETLPISESLTPYETCQLCRGRVLPSLANNVAMNLNLVSKKERVWQEAQWNRSAETTLRSGGGIIASSAPKRQQLPQAMLQLDSESVARAGGKPELYQPHAVRMDGGREILNDLSPTKDTFLSAQNAGFFNLVDGACLHHWQYGILIGYGFAAVFAAGSVAAGYICDRRSRVSVMSIVLLMWSVATSLQASGHNFLFLIFCRAAVGLAQAFVLPVTVSLTADYFTDKQGIVVAVLSVGQYIGSGCASLSILFAGIIGWRWTVLLTGLIGIVLSPIFYHTVREPERTEWSAPCAISVVREEVLEKSRVARSLIVAGSFKMLGSCSLAAFLPIWYARRGMEGYSNTTYALVNALVISTGGLTACFIGSFVGHKWSQRDCCAPCWIGLFGAIFSLPLICMVMLTSRFSVSMQCLFLLVVFSESWYGPTVSLLQASVRKSVRGQSMSMFLVLSTLAGNLGPAVVGFLDLGREQIGLHLIWISTFANAAAAAAFLWTAREIRYDPVAAGHKQEVVLKEADSKLVGAAHWNVL